ncbi:MAG TPA: thermonuclease family protein, partial [Phycisphaerae bacterium]|nr:thermonuclease family protein [Phycisphaerae bacterium]
MKTHRIAAGFILIVGLAAVGLGAAGGPETPAPPAALVNVSKMLDGDSLVATTGRQTVGMRLYDVDAPEYDTPEGQRAGQLANRLVAGRRVWVFPSGERRHDAYGRLLVRIWLPQGGWLSDRLLGAGLARRYV